MYEDDYDTQASQKRFFFSHVYFIRSMPYGNIHSVGFTR